MTLNGLNTWAGVAVPPTLIKVLLKLPTRSRSVGHGGQSILSLIKHQVVIAAEEEQLVFHNRPGNRPTELIHLEGRPLQPVGIIRIGIGVERFIAQEVGCLAVILVGAGLGRERNDALAMYGYTPRVEVVVDDP